MECLLVLDKRPCDTQCILKLKKRIKVVTDWTSPFYILEQDFGVKSIKCYLIGERG